MTTGVFKHNMFQELEEVDQKAIDYWCQQCQFPYGESKCQSKELIQRCWFELHGIAQTLDVGSEAHIWHLQHECPFVHQGERCRCNDFKTVEGAFQATGLEYKKGSSP